MNKILAIAALVIAMAGQASAGGAALEKLSELSGPEAAAQAPAPETCKEPGPGATIEEIIAWIRCVELPAPAGQAGEKRASVHPKIRVSPVTAAWKDVMLVRFRGVSFDTVRAAMSAAGARSWTFGENGGEYIVRLEIADAKAPAMARSLAAQPAVDAVEVNRSVYAALAGGNKAAAERNLYLTEFFDEWGDGAEKIPAVLRAAGLQVAGVEEGAGTVSVTYRSARGPVKTEETRGQYGPGDGAKIDREARAIRRRLETAGAVVVWTGRWGDMVNGATVYYLERSGAVSVRRYGGLFDELNPEACPGWQEAGDGSAVCRVDGAWKVFRLPVRREHQVERLPFNGLWDAVSLNIWPDDCTDLIYQYSYELFDAAGRKAGYAQRHGYANSEMGSRLDLLLRYDLREELVSVTAY